MYICCGGIFLCSKAKRQGGFTLVETLIVMLIIAVLSGMVMFIAVSAIDYAAATKIVSDFKAIQKASVMSQIENKEWWPGGTSDEEDKVSVLAAEYTDSPNINDGEAYRIWGGPSTPLWGIFLIVDLTKMKKTEQLKSIFKAKANGGFGVQLFDKNYNTNDLKNNKGKPYNGGDSVYFCISQSYY